MSNRQHYGSIDGLRSLSMLCIVMMHVLTNCHYNLGGVVFDTVIPSFTNAVYLFMVISGFSLCCGYFDRMNSGNITPEQFYSRRIGKIWPFFALVTLLDLVMSWDVTAVYEAFANLTLCFGLLPNPSISVIGVGWTLGVIFVFYLLFPFFCYLLKNQRRAWIGFIVALVYNILCSIYFFDDKHMLPGFSSRNNILYCAVYFFAGGMIYIYREKLASIAHRLWFLFMGLIFVGFLAYYTLGSSMPVMVILFTLIMIYSIGRGDKTGVLSNPVMKFISKYSLELYLSHMIIFRVVQKLMQRIQALPDFAEYIVVVLLTVCGTLAFSMCSQWMISRICRWFRQCFSARNK